MFDSDRNREHDFVRLLVLYDVGVQKKLRITYAQWRLRDEWLRGPLRVCVGVKTDAESLGLVIGWLVAELSPRQRLLICSD